MISAQECPLRDEKKKKASTKRWFLNRCNFAYGRRDDVNQAFKNLDKTAPALIQNLKGELNDVLQQGIHQVIRESGA